MTAAYAPVLEAAVAMVEDAQALGAELHLYGSVATGQAVTGRSDVDLLAIGVPHAVAADLAQHLARWSALRPERAASLDVLRSWSEEEAPAAPTDVAEVLSKGGLLDHVVDEFASTIGLWRRSPGHLGCPGSRDGTSVPPRPLVRTRVVAELAQQASRDPGRSALGRRG